MNRKKLYISDLDGTLIEDGKSLNEEIIELLNLAITDDKKELIISSARNYYSIKKKIDGLKKSIKVVSRNGSVIYDEFGKVIYAVYIHSISLFNICYGYIQRKKYAFLVAWELPCELSYYPCVSFDI